MVQDTHLNAWVSQAQESGPSHTIKQSLYLRHCQHPSEHGVIISEPMLSNDLKQASSWWQSLHEGIDFLKLLAGGASGCLCCSDRPAGQQATTTTKLEPFFENSAPA